MARKNLGRGWLRVLWLFGGLSLMAGCGQKGALVLPPAETAATTAPIPAANATSNFSSNTGARNHD